MKRGRREPSKDAYMCRWRQFKVFYDDIEDTTFELLHTLYNQYMVDNQFHNSSNVNHLTL